MTERGFPGERSAMTSPLAFPSADGPGRPEAAIAPSAPAPAGSAQRPWPLSSVLPAAMCAVAVVSILLHNGLGLAAVDEAVAAAQRDRADRALQAVEVKFRLDADDARDIAQLLARSPAFQDALHNARDRQALIEQARHQSGVDRIDLIDDSNLHAAAGTSRLAQAVPTPGTTLLQDRDGEPMVRYAKRVGADQGGWGWITVERHLSGQMVRDLSAALGVDIRVADAAGTLVSTSAADTGCFGPEQVSGMLGRRPLTWTGRDPHSDCLARSSSIGGLRVALLAQVPQEAAAPGLAAARRQFAWIAELTLAAAALSGLMLARRLVRPIRMLSARAEELALRYTGHALEHSRNEMHELRESFEAMTRALLGQLERLQGMHLDEMQNSLELQRRYALMRLLRDLSTATHESQTLQQAFGRALEELGGYLDWPLGRVLIVTHEGGQAGAACQSIWFSADRKRFAGFISESEALPMDASAQGLIGRARVTGMPHWVTDLSRLESWRRRELALQNGLKSAFVIPVTVDGAPSAFIEFFTDHRVEASAEMIELIEAIHTELWQAGERHRGQGSAFDARCEPAMAQSR